AVLRNLISLIVLTNVRRYFFFQAEDGIRDKLVTGVQTCALPISLALLETRLTPSERIDLLARSAEALAKVEGIEESLKVQHNRLKRLQSTLSVAQSEVDAALRSEERRVGKEGRCAWETWCEKSRE